MNGKEHFKLLILGSGPAGYSAAVYAARANLSPAIITGIEQGGQLMTTTDVDNWPGDDEGVQGPDLMIRMQKHAERFDTKTIYDHINDADLSSRPFKLQGDKALYTCDALIIATGLNNFICEDIQNKPIEVLVFQLVLLVMVSFIKIKIVAVVGGGNAAQSNQATIVLKDLMNLHLIHRRDKLKAEKILQDQLFKKEKEGKIKIHWNHVVDEVLGDETGVNALSIKGSLNEKKQTIDLSGIFIAIGHSPNTNLFNNQLIMNNGYIKIKAGLEGDATSTNIPGVFAVGDVSDQIYRQAITSAGAGCMGALDAEKYLDALIN